MCGFNNLNGVYEVGYEILPSAPDYGCMENRSNTPSMPGWNGFMEQVTSGLDFDLSRTIFLPFIRAPPTDYDTLTQCSSPFLNPVREA
jgi:hypothetical protein